MYFAIKGLGAILLRDTYDEGDYGCTVTSSGFKRLPSLEDL